MESPAGMTVRAQQPTDGEDLGDKGEAGGTRGHASSARAAIGSARSNGPRDRTRSTPGTCSANPTCGPLAKRRRYNPAQNPAHASGLVSVPTSTWLAEARPKVAYGIPWYKLREPLRNFPSWASMIRHALGPDAGQDWGGGIVDAGGRGVPSGAAWCRGLRLNFRDFRAAGAGLQVGAERSHGHRGNLHPPILGIFAGLNPFRHPLTRCVGRGLARGASRGRPARVPSSHPTGARRRSTPSGTPPNAA